MLQMPISLAFQGTDFTARALIATGVSEALRAEWQALAFSASETNVFSEPWFVASALEHLRGGDVVRLAKVRDAGGELVGILPLAASPKYGRLNLAHTTNWIHLQNYCGMPLIRAGHEEAFWTALLDLLDRSKWACGFLGLRLMHADGPVMRGLNRAAAATGRRIHTGQVYDRAMLASQAAPDAYLEATVRPKKRKELRRLAKRLAEHGHVSFERLAPDGPLDAWCDQYLALEASGWKGQGNTALAADQDWIGFFRETMASAQALGKLDFMRLALDGKPVAMLINLRAPPAAWSYKITYDEALGRFSPGVLLEIEALAHLLEDPEIAWVDSCAKPDHPMINSLWGERLRIAHVAVSLKGPGRRLHYSLCRGIDSLGTLIRQNGARNDD